MKHTFYMVRNLNVQVNERMFELEEEAIKLATELANSNRTQKYVVFKALKIAEVKTPAIVTVLRDRTYGEAKSDGSEFTTGDFGACDDERNGL